MIQSLPKKLQNNRTGQQSTTHKFFCQIPLVPCLLWIRTLNLPRTTRSKLIPLLTGNCSFQEQHKRRLFLVIIILFDGTAHILHLLITLQWYCQLLYHAKKLYILSRTQCGLSCRPRLSSVLIHMKQFFLSQTLIALCVIKIIIMSLA